MSIVSYYAPTARLQTHLLDSGGAGRPLLFVHGNVSSSEFYEKTLLALPGGLRGVAPDLRGFGASEPKPIDATRGLGDFADDLHSLVEHLGLASAHRLILVGWSLGGGVVMQYAIDHPEQVAGLVLLAPISPYGFGGTRDTAGTPCWPDWAGSGAGAANPQFVSRLAAADRSVESEVSPRRVMNSFYFKPPFRVDPDDEERFVSALLATRTGDDHYPGDTHTSPHWPGVAPGTRGVINAVSPRYCDLSGFVRISPQLPVLWLRGADDQIVSDTSLFDFGFLGQIGAVPGWPGAEVYPPQPMIGQLRALLDGYRARGGRYEEVVLPDCGHSPHLERPREFLKLLHSFLEQTR